MTRFPGKLEMQVVKNSHGAIYCYVPDERQDKWIRKWFPITKNDELIEAMKIEPCTFRRLIKRMGLKKDTKYLKANGKKAASRIKKYFEENGRKPSKNPKSSHLWTKQKGPFVTVATKISKEDYDKFVDVLKANKTTKFEVIRCFVQTYINNFK